MSLVDAKECDDIIEEMARWAYENYREDVLEHLDITDEVAKEVMAMIDTEEDDDLYNVFDSDFSIPMVDEQLSEDVDEDSLESAIVVAAAYEWICPSCNEYNRTAEATAVVKCSHCKKRFEANLQDY